MIRVYYSLYGPYIVKFIELKNSLGYKYKDAGWSLSLLDKIAQKNDVNSVAITKELADEYGLKRPNETDKSRYNRIQILRQFAQFLCDLGIGSHIPILPRYGGGFTPYIFSHEQMLAIFRVCDGLSPTCRNRNSAVFAIPFLMRLLYGTGIRIGEAIRLSIDDIDLTQQYLILKDTKNGKDRMVPFDESLGAICKDYLRYRALFHGSKNTNRLFILPDGRLFNETLAYKWFRKIIWAAGIPHGGKSKGPRMHDLRHTMAVHSLATMARKGLDMYHSLPLLSIYLGHQSLTATDGYVRLTKEMYPDLLKQSGSITSCVFPPIKNQDDDQTH